MFGQVLGFLSSLGEMPPYSEIRQGKRCVAQPCPAGRELRATRPEPRARDRWTLGTGGHRRVNDSRSARSGSQHIASPHLATEHSPGPDEREGRALLHASSRRMDRRRHLAWQSGLVTDRADENRSRESAAAPHHSARSTADAGPCQQASLESALVRWRVFVRLGCQSAGWNR